MKKTIEIEVKVGKCDDCYFRVTEGGSGPMMVCNHHNALDGGYIISWKKDYSERCSNKCPLKVQNKRFIK